MPAPVLTTFRVKLWKLVVIYAVTMGVYQLINSVAHHALNWYTFGVYSPFGPIALIGLIGVYAINRKKASKFAGKVDNVVVFLIPTIGKPDVIPALQGVVDSVLQYAPQRLPNFWIDLVMEEGTATIAGLQRRYAGTRVRIIVVPRSYRTPKGTRFKARANEYAMQLRRREGHNTANDWVYHLDDDTEVRADTVSSIAEFIATQSHRYHLAQGVLTYPFEKGPSWVTRLADSIRPIDDMTRFHLFSGVIHTPLVGLHGEHLLIRASIEDEIGWDFGPNVLVEDAYFAVKFAEAYPGRATFLNSCCYGASPATVADLVKQRGRWAQGLYGMAFDKTFKRRSKLILVYSVINWTLLGLPQHIFVVIGMAVVLQTPSTSPAIPWLLPVLCFSFSYQVWSYLEGLRINLEVSAGKWRYALQALALLACLPLISLVEAYAAGKGVVKHLKGVHEFVVINKELTLERRIVLELPHHVEDLQLQEVEVNVD